MNREQKRVEVYCTKCSPYFPTPSLPVHGLRGENGRVLIPPKYRPSFYHHIHHIPYSEDGVGGGGGSVQVRWDPGFHLFTGGIRDLEEFLSGRDHRCLDIGIRDL